MIKYNGDSILEISEEEAAHRTQMMLQLAQAVDAVGEDDDTEMLLDDLVAGVGAHYLTLADDPFATLAMGTIGQVIMAVLAANQLRIDGWTFDPTAPKLTVTAAGIAEAADAPTE